MTDRERELEEMLERAESIIRDYAPEFTEWLKWARRLLSKPSETPEDATGRSDAASRGKEPVTRPGVSDSSPAPAGEREPLEPFELVRHDLRSRERVAHGDGQRFAEQSLYSARLVLSDAIREARARLAAHYVPRKVVEERIHSWLHPLVTDFGNAELTDQTLRTLRYCADDLARALGETPDE